MNKIKREKDKNMENKTNLKQKIKLKGLRKSAKGITLIALVITIIVLLILAGVSISILTGENGILKQVHEAKINTEISNEREKIQLAIIGSKISKDGYEKIDIKKLEKELNQQFGEDQSIINENSDDTFTIKIKKSQNEYDVLENGSIQQVTRSIKPTSVYALVYSDGTLSFNTTGKTNESKINVGTTVLYNTKDDENIGDISQIEFKTETETPWYDYVEKITSIDIEEPIAPISTAFWFSYCNNVQEINLKNLYTNNVITMKGMFYNCVSLEKLDLSNFNTENVIVMYAMFLNCTNLKEINLSRFNTKKVTNVSWMFGRCNELTYLNLYNFDTSNVTSFAAMFYNDSKLTEILVGNAWKTDLADTSSMFYKCGTNEVIYIK